MCTKFELLGVGVEICLVFQIALIIFAHIVIDEGDGYDYGPRSNELHCQVDNC